MFDELMAQFAPFEPAPRIAVAVSGGADSLALLLLLDGWTRARGGRVLALTVDHGLRLESGAEAAWVAGLCAERGIAHRTLAWRPIARPGAGRLQAEARDARYRLLAAACREAGVLHLAVGHHLEDQSETFLLRLAAGSGPDGLAAMPAVGFADAVRILRPLLTQPRAGLEALLRGAGQDWLHDPSNDDPAYARIRLRKARSLLDPVGLTPATCADVAAAYGSLRRWSEIAVARLLAEACRLDPRGFAWLDRPRLAAAPRPLALRALGQALRTVAGRHHTPRGPKLERLLARLKERSPHAATLAGCKILSRRGDRLLLVRETAGICETVEETAAGRLWDGRFRLAGSFPATAGTDDEWPGTGKEHANVPSFARLSAAERREILAADGVAGRRLHTVPAAACMGLPLSCDLDGRMTLPHLTATLSVNEGQDAVAGFLPRRRLTDGSFTVFR